MHVVLYNPYAWSPYAAHAPWPLHITEMWPNWLALPNQQNFWPYIGNYGRWTRWRMKF